jgi:hypothetical protein
MDKGKSELKNGIGLNVKYFKEYKNRRIYLYLETSS